MFDKLDDLLIRYEEIMNELSEPGVADNQDRFRRLMKEQNDLAPIVEAYKEYKANNQAIEDSLAMLEEETDEEMKELAKEELNESKARVEELEQKLKILLLPKDPNDDKNVSWRSAPERAAMRRLSSQPRSTACTSTTRRAAGGRQS